MSLKQKKVSHGMQGVFVFVLLGAFALLGTLMVLLGAQMYRGTVEYASQNNDQRVLSAYVRSMVRAYDRADSVSIAQYGDVTALEMRETWDDEEYIMRLYCWQDSLYEQYTDAGYDFDPAMGDAVCAVQGFDPELSDGILTVNMTDQNGEQCVVQVSLRAAL